MSKYRQTVSTLLIAIAACAGVANHALAQSWPSRPVTLVVPYGPGASNDLFTRALATQLSKKFNQPFVVENRAGAGGFTGSSAVSRATPDGYLLLENSNSMLTMEPVMKVKFDAAKDLTPIAMLAQAPNVMVIPSAIPAKTIAEFVTYAKANPDKTFYGTTAPGSTQQLHAEQLNVLTGTSLKPVVYKSSADAQVDLVAGRLQVMFATYASVSGQIASGELRLLGYTGPGSPPGVPNAPTMEDAGIKGFQGQIWWGMFAPAGMSRELQATINAAINDAIQTPEFVAFLHKNGATPAVHTAPQFTEAVGAEYKALLGVIKAANLKFE